MPRHHGISCFSALHARLDSKCLWVGQAGVHIEPGVNRSNLRKQLLAECVCYDASTTAVQAGLTLVACGVRGRYNYVPVFVSARKAELHYSGYCKSVLSPAFHSVPFSTDFHMNTHDSEEPEHSEKFMWEVRTR